MNGEKQGTGVNGPENAANGNKHLSKDELDEDDGIVLTIVIDNKGERSILAALNGKTLMEVARAEMPQVYGMGPHGSFIDRRGMY